MGHGNLHDHSLVRMSIECFNEWHNVCHVVSNVVAHNYISFRYQRCNIGPVAKISVGNSAASLCCFEKFVEHFLLVVNRGQGSRR